MRKSTRKRRACSRRSLKGEGETGCCFILAVPVLGANVVGKCDCPADRLPGRDHGAVGRYGWHSIPAHGKSGVVGAQESRYVIVVIVKLGGLRRDPEVENAVYGGGSCRHQQATRTTRPRCQTDRREKMKTVRRRGESYKVVQAVM